MHPITDVDWQTLLVPSVGLLELVLRGSAMYLFIFVAMRLFRRDSGGLSTADLLVVVLVADAGQNAMASEYHSLTEGVVLVGTIFAWNYGLDWLAFRFAAMRRLLHPPPLLLVENGRIHGRNLRSEMISRADLAEYLREQGIGDVSEVSRCYLEGDGHVSVIRRSTDDDAPAPKGRGVAGSS
jgi:uncharacterized membrane protein YcaP (DUF421 family)